jgi:hypothetical protein
LVGGKLWHGTFTCKPHNPGFSINLHLQLDPNQSLGLEKLNFWKCKIPVRRYVYSIDAVLVTSRNSDSSKCTYQEWQVLTSYLYNFPEFHLLGSHLQENLWKHFCKKKHKRRNQRRTPLTEAGPRQKNWIELKKTTHLLKQWCLHKMGDSKRGSTCFSSICPHWNRFSTSKKFKHI